MPKQAGNIRIMLSMLGLVKPLSGYMFIAVLTGVIGFLCAIFIPVYGFMAIGTVLGYASHFTVSKLFAFMIMFAVMRGILHYIEQACNHYIAFRILAIMRDKVFQTLRKLAPARMEGKDSGNLISLVTNDIELLEVFYAHTISPIMIAVLTCTLLLVLFGHFHIMFALLALLAYICVGIVFPWIITKLGKHDGQNMRDSSGEFSSYMLESLRGLQNIQQYGIGQKRLSGIKKRSHRLNDVQSKLKDYEGISSALNNIGVTSFAVIMLLLGIYLNQSGQVSMVMVLFACVLMISSFGPVLALSSLSNNLLLTLASARRVLSLLAEKESIKEVNDQEIICFDDMTLSSASFAYEEENILDNVSATFQKHTITGIFGKSGSGKSTMLRLLMRFWDVQKGSVQIGHKDVKHVNTSNLRDMQSFVTQETILFHDTIANNLKIARLDASQEQIEEACRKASIHEFIMTLPHGYETMVQELGESLSGGERQRLGVARAFLHDSDCILLDEPTSNLDALNEAVILKSLKEQKDKTIILVSHRPSTMKIAHFVIQMDNGRNS